MTTPERIQHSWNVRKKLIGGILERGDTLVAALKLVPETRDSLTFDKWKAIVARELDEAKRLYGNGEPLLSEQEITTLALILNPSRGW